MLLPESSAVFNLDKLTSKKWAYHIKTLNTGLLRWSSKNPPANLRTWIKSLAQEGLIPHAMGQLSPCAPTTEPVPWKPRAAAAEDYVLHRRTHHDEKPIN